MGQLIQLPAHGVRLAAEQLAATVLDAFDSHRWVLLWSQWICLRCGLLLEATEGRRCTGGRPLDS